MENKEIEKIQDKKKVFDVCMLVMGVVFILSGIVYLILDKFASDKTEQIYLICWLVYSVYLVLMWLVGGIVLNKKEKFIRVNNYNFDRGVKPEHTITTFEDLISQEKVIFNRKKLRYLGGEFAYDELQFDYLTYQDDILLHIYLKENDEKPLLIFKVTEEFYYCMKFFKLHMDLLDREIDMFNLNFIKK